jgi:hypothetical protein
LYENGKMRPVKTISGMGWGIKENDGWGNLNYNCKNFGKRHNVPPVQQ